MTNGKWKMENDKWKMTHVTGIQVNIHPMTNALAF
jgi:hypothetical protein